MQQDIVSSNCRTGDLEQHLPVSLEVPRSLLAIDATRKNMGVVPFASHRRIPACPFLSAVIGEQPMHVLLRLLRLFGYPYFVPVGGASPEEDALGEDANAMSNLGLLTNDFETCRGSTRRAAELRKKEQWLASPEVEWISPGQRLFPDGLCYSGGRSSPASFRSPQDTSGLLAHERR